MVRKPIPAYRVWVFAGYGYGYSSQYLGVYPCYSLWMTTWDLRSMGWGWGERVDGYEYHQSHRLISQSIDYYTGTASRAPTT